MKLLAWLVSVVIIGGAVFYFLPREWKINGITSLTDIIPEQLKEKTESLLLSPPEARAKLLNSLEENLAKIEENPSSPDTAKILNDSEEILMKLKEKNDDLSLTEIVKTKLVEQFIKASSTQCTPP